MENRKIAALLFGLGIIAAAGGGASTSGGDATVATYVWFGAMIVLMIVGGIYLRLSRR